MVRKATDRDLDFIYRLYMHPDVNLYLMYEIMDEDFFKPIFEELKRQEALYVYEENGKRTGMFKLIPDTYRSAHVVYLGGLAIDPASGGKGAGSRMMQEIIDYSIRQGFSRIELSVSVENERAIHVYTKAGFEKEGILKKYTYLATENRYVDEIMMAYVAE
jgi:putative acetyltransferase